MLGWLCIRGTQLRRSIPRQSEILTQTNLLRDNDLQEISFDNRVPNCQVVKRRQFVERLFLLQPRRTNILKITRAWCAQGILIHVSTEEGKMRFELGSA